MSHKERSEWILVPETSNKIGLHYHGFIKLNARPNLGNAYRSEWFWMKAAFDNTLKKINKDYKEYKLGAWIVERSHPQSRDAQKVFYTLKQLATNNDKQMGLSFDPFAYLIMSVDWKPSQLHQHRSITKLSAIPPRRNKQFETDLTRLSI